MISIILVCDASPMITLGDKLEHLGLFKKLYQKYTLRIPKIVYKDELTCDPTRNAIDKLIDKGIVELGTHSPTDDIIDFRRINKCMHLGESAVWFERKKLIKDITEKIAKKEIKKGDMIVICVTDDKDAQKFMRENEADVKSSEDLGHQLKKDGDISQEELEEILKKLKE